MICRLVSDNFFSLNSLWAAMNWAQNYGNNHRRTPMNNFFAPAKLQIQASKRQRLDVGPNTIDVVAFDGEWQCADIETCRINKWLWKWHGRDELGEYLTVWTCDKHESSLNAWRECAERVQCCKRHAKGFSVAQVTSIICSTSGVIISWYYWFIRGILLNYIGYWRTNKLIDHVYWCGALEHKRCSWEPSFGKIPGGK